MSGQPSARRYGPRPEGPIDEQRGRSPSRQRATAHLLLSEVVENGFVMGHCNKWGNLVRHSSEGVAGAEASSIFLLMHGGSLPKSMRKAA